MTGMVTRVVAALAAGSMVVVTGAGVASAGSGSASLAGVTVAYSVPDRVNFDGPGCLVVPWTLSYQMPADETRAFDYRVEVRAQGSNSSADYDSDNIFSWNPATGSATGALCIQSYDFDPVGMFVGGLIQVEDGEGNWLGETAMSQALVNVSRNPTRFVRLKARAGRTYDRPPVIKGKVVAQTTTRGTMGADGEIVVEAMSKGKWRTVDSSVTPDEFGRFSAIVYKRVPKGMKIRVRLSDCGWCTNAKAVTRAG